MSTSQASTFLEKECRKFGIPPLIPLDAEPGPEHLNYLDLLRAKKKQRAKERMLPDAVAEFQGRPLLYLLDGTRHLGKENQIRAVQLLLANRGEHAWVGVVQPGQITVYPINLDPQELAASGPEVITVSEPNYPLFFQRLISTSEPFPGMPDEADYVFEKIHNLLQGASAELTGPESKPMKPLEVLSTTGRALFFRFLHDRGIIRVDDLDEICPETDSADLLDVFSNASKAAATSAWLDETFNGDLLPLVEGLEPETSKEQRRKEYLAYFRRAGRATGGRLFAHLEAILRGWDHVGGSQFQYTIDWDDLDFAHIPVGVLSQVYETFSHQWDAPSAKETSVHYTPRRIAQLVVTESLSHVVRPASARVLDPACGAGVFLVIAFRELVRHRWIADGRRPTKETIHRILYNQLSGFDVSEHALRLAALGLYITAIELSSIHRPPSLHRAPKALQGTVLHNFDEPSAHPAGRRRFVLGSLGDGPNPEFEESFDVVLGNPPWTPLTPKGTAEEKLADKVRIKGLNHRFSELGRSELSRRGLDRLANSYRNPNNAPDIPFVWRAMRWAKPQGIIGFTLDARLVLMQDRTYRYAREALIQSCSVAGILNGSSLEKTAVWPGMDKAFIIFVARNAIPAPDHSFYFATPVRETILSKRGEFRLDYTTVQSVAIASVVGQPWYLKALSVGSSLDIEVIEKLEAAFSGTTVQTVWAPPLFTGRGFSLNPRSSDPAPQWLQELTLFEVPEEGKLLEMRAPATFKDCHGDRAPYQTCGPEIYMAPLLVIPQAPGEGRSKPKAFLSTDISLCYSQSFYGYSGGKHEHSALYLSLLYLILHSELFSYWCLVRSSRIGATWRTFIKEDVDSFPFPDAEQLTSRQRRQTESIARDLVSGGVQEWAVVDDFINSLYGLSTSDVEVVRDTVEFRSPYSQSRLPAERAPEPKEVIDFCKRLEELLQPLFSLTHQRIKVEAVPLSGHGEMAWMQPWRFISISVLRDSKRLTSASLVRIMQTVSKTSASRVIVRVPGGELVLGLLNQRRFWTRSRARLCAVEVAREHSDWLPMPGSSAPRKRATAK